jgi:hypothetical protein
MKIIKLVEKFLCSVSILLTSVISFSAIALPVNAQQSMTLSAGECFVVVASRQFLYEVSEFLNGLDDGFTDIRVFKSTNNWYAISVGKVPSNVSASVISSLVASNRIPSDSICSTGKSYLREMDITELKQPQKKNPKATEYRGELTLLTDSDLVGQDLTPNGIGNTNLIDCLLFCSGDTECRSLTHDTRRDICYLKTHENANNAAEKVGLVSLLLPSEVDRAIFDEQLSMQNLLAALSNESDQKSQQNTDLPTERNFFDRRTAFYGMLDKEYRNVEFTHCSSLLTRKLNHIILMFDQYGSYFIAMASYTDDLQNIVGYSDLSDFAPAGSYVITNDGNSEFLLLPSDSFDEYYSITENDKIINLAKLVQNRRLDKAEYVAFLVKQRGIEREAFRFKACRL